MALTLREVSEPAESAIEFVMERYHTINTKTKAIDFILSSYLTQLEEIDTLKNSKDHWFAEFQEKEKKLEEVKSSLRVFFHLIQKENDSK